MNRPPQYLDRRERHLAYSYLALSDWFESKDQLTEWFYKLPSDHRRDTFLKVAPRYLALVKHGDWHVDIPDSNPIVDYFTETYKFVAIIALIESLSDERHLDFYQFLTAKDSKGDFPLERGALDGKYRAYKELYGANRRCIAFFKLLPKSRQDELAELLQLAEPSVSIETFVSFLYQVRSDFVHGAEFAHEISQQWAVTKFRGKTAISKITITDAMKLFEEGLLLWCNQE